MSKALFDRATSKYVGTFVRRDDVAIPHDSGTHIVIVVASEPDVRTDYWDGATGIRAATQQELDDFDEEKLEGGAVAKVNTPLNKTLRDLLMDIEVRLRAAGQTSSIPEIAAATNKAEYQTALKDILKTYS